jgi:Histidine kinase-like ATPase domain
MQKLLQPPHACERMRLSAPDLRGARDRTVMTALPWSPVGNAARGLGHAWLAPVLEIAAVASGNWPLRPDPGPGGWTCFPRVAARSLGGPPRPVRAARDFAVATVRRWDAAERAEDVAIVVSELVTNALQHGLPASGPAQPAGRVRFGLLQAGPCVVCAVADPSRAVPVMRETDVLAETGRGLHVVDVLADAWGCITPGDTGKTVWAMFSAGPRPVSALPGARRGR